MAKQEEYIDFLERQIKELLNDGLFQNYKRQLLARKLKADFNHSYSFSYIWDKINVLITLSCFLLKRQDENECAISALKTVAEICENLSIIEDYNWDENYANIMSALCYDLSGYQSNANCVIKELNDYSIEKDFNECFDDDEVIFKQILLILKNRISYANFILKRQIKLSEQGILLKKALLSWYDNILNLKNTEFLTEMHTAYEAFLYSNNVYLTKIIQLLEIKVIVSQKRSLFTVLGCNGIDIYNPIWVKYLKILSNDYYSNIGVKAVEERGSLYELWVSQRKAIEQGLFTKNQNFVVQMPTSAGKTFIAELFILNKLVNNPQKRCLYISPFRALATEKERDFGKILGKIGYSASSINGGYDQDIFQNVVYEHADILVATPEKIDLLSRLDDAFFDNIEGIVVDEGHIVGEVTPRAALLEMLLSRIKIQKPNIAILFISAVMPKENADEYSIWLSGNKENVLRSTRFFNQEDWQPTRKIVGNLHYYNGNWRVVFREPSPDYKSNEPTFINSFLTPNMYGNGFPSKPDSKGKIDKIALTTSLAHKLSEKGGVLVFCGTVQFVRYIGTRFCRLYKSLNISASGQWGQNPNTNSYYYARIFFGENHWITECILYGVGVHFGSLPEMLRKNIEQDYKRNHLKILLSTNTISQGVNFPIKYLIIHNLILDYKDKQMICLTQRDFRNLIGRAGRAGFETEGYIYFINNSRTDSDFYSRYIACDNIEKANSIILTVYSLFLSNKINEDTLSSYLSIILDSELMALFSEDVWNSDCNEIVERLVSNSLFGTQCSIKGFDSTELKKSIKKCFFSIKEKSETFDKLIVYKKTGFSVDFSKTMFLYIQKNVETLDTSSLEKIIYFFLCFIQQNGYCELSELSVIPQEKWLETSSILILWIHGEPINEIKKLFFKITGSDKDGEFLKFMSQAVDYFLPWLLSVFVGFIVEIKKESLSESDVKELKSIPLYLKYGLDNKLACLARSMGVLSRDVALRLSRESDVTNERDFISWLVSQEKEDFDALNLNSYEQSNIVDVAKKYNRNKEPLQKAFVVKGTRYNQNLKEASLKTSLWESVQLVRDTENDHDAFAIKVIASESGFLGYVPANIAPYYAVEMDVNEKEFFGMVTKLISYGEYNEIEVDLYSVMKST
ncbi:MAG: DEAD/DEAH box helicase [Alphaproteobacteria bacterium]|nr:DEAD/DEAH box helicase [Alphaproteobacteria bacterium]MBO7551613.1 DEAD/DEAH box helicase [Fibrobacter sp.]